MKHKLSKTFSSTSVKKGQLYRSLTDVQNEKDMFGIASRLFRALSSKQKRKFREKYDLGSATFSDWLGQNSTKLILFSNFVETYLTRGRFWKNLVAGVVAVIATILPFVKTPEWVKVLLTELPNLLETWQ